jgi:hypothetical protein
LFKSLESHSELLESLLVLHKNQRQRLDALEDILSTLRTGYNPNYQDMAVLEAVRGWEQVAGLPHINDVKKGEDGGGGNTPPSDDQSEVSDEETERKVDSILKTNRVSLLMEHDKYVDQAPASSICELLSPASSVQWWTFLLKSPLSLQLLTIFARLPQASSVTIPPRLTPPRFPKCVSRFLTLRQFFAKQRISSRVREETWKTFSNPTGSERMASGKSWTGYVWKRTRASTYYPPPPDTRILIFP